MGYACKNSHGAVSVARDAETSLRLAQQFVHGETRTHRTILMRHRFEPPPATLLELKQSEAALRARGLESDESGH
jgi:hypothetical protein